MRTTYGWLFKCFGPPSYALEKALNAVYGQHIYPDPRGSAKKFGIIMGISTPDDPPLLFKTAGTGVLISDSWSRFNLINMGAEDVIVRFKLDGNP